MTKSAVIKLALKHGFKVWGKKKSRKNGSIYQCYRKGNLYLWIGNMYIERNEFPVSI